MRNKKTLSKDSIMLFVQLPFWAPLIPPQGIARINKYLKIKGYNNVTCVDINIDLDFKEVYEDYFNTAKDFIPKELHGNFYDNGHDILRYHLMTNLNCKNKKDKFELVEILFHTTYLYKLSSDEIEILDKILDRFYLILESKIIDLLEKNKPDLIGFSLHSGNFPSTLFSCQLINKKMPSVNVIVGGSMFAGELRPESPDFKLFIKRVDTIIDKIFIGLSEQTVEKYLKGEIPKDKKIVTQDDLTEEKMSINSFVTPELSDFDLSKYATTACYSSMSCPNTCSFCNERTFWGEYQQKDTKLAMKELLSLYKQYRPSFFFMLDVLMNPSIDAFTKAISETKLPIYFDGYIRVSDESCSLEKCLQWRQGGFYRARMGLESGSQRMLDEIDKGITIEQSKKTLRNLATAGIKTTGYFVIGHPGETEYDFNKTLDFIEESKDFFWQIEPHVFNYLHTGQISNDIWSEKRKLFYPEKFMEDLVCQKYYVDIEPNRTTVIERLLKIVAHCDKLGIKNPYYSYDKFNADLRWKKLHKNAVPTILELSDNNVIDHVRNVSNRLEASMFSETSGEFNF